MANTRCRIGMVFSPDYGHIVARNTYRKAINILRKLCTKLVLFIRSYKDARSTKHKKSTVVPVSVHRINVKVNRALGRKIPCSLSSWVVGFMFRLLYSQDTRRVEGYVVRDTASILGVRIKVSASTTNRRPERPDHIQLFFMCCWPCILVIFDFVFPT